MANLIAFPFRLAPSGFVVTLPDDSDEYMGDELGLLVGTTPGERELVPNYGLNDPTFNNVDANELAVKVAMFGPPVQIASVSHTWAGVAQQDVIIEFEPQYRPTLR